MAKVTPKISELALSPHAEAVATMFRAGEPPSSVQEYLAGRGYKISTPTLYKYKELLELGALPKPGEAITYTSAGAKDADVQSHLLLELKALDAVIQKGYEALQNMKPERVTPKIMMEAIRLKYELTGGDHLGLTEYGYKSLKQLDDQKWRAVLEYMLPYIPEAQREEVRTGIAQLEEGIYKGTPWYDDYKSARSNER